MCGQQSRQCHAASNSPAPDRKKGLRNLVAWCSTTAVLNTGITHRNGACSSAGEHYVDIVGVTGSIPVTPTISPTRKIHKIKILHLPCSIGLCCLLSPDSILLSVFYRDSLGMKRVSPIVKYPSSNFWWGHVRKTNCFSHCQASSARRQEADQNP